MKRDRVLVVDDAPATLALLTDALEDAGMTVLVAVDGPSAIARAQRTLPDIILLDAVMPGVDGFETCRRLKSVPTVAGIPVLFMTGLTETEDVVRGFQAGGVDYVTKPIAPDELIARMRAHLANARRMSSAQDALDLTGRALFSLAPDGTVGWQTPEAARALSPPGSESGPSGKLPRTTHQQLAAALAEGRNPQRAPAVSIDVDGRRLLLRALGRTAAETILVGVDAVDGTRDDARLRDRFGLTARECEVLVWIARGKSNRDIGMILELSPRTVNKHLEHIYVKLGVENRTAAAAVATSVLAGRESP